MTHQIGAFEARVPPSQAGRCQSLLARGGVDAGRGHPRDADVGCRAPLALAQAQRALDERRLGRRFSRRSLDADAQQAASRPRRLRHNDLIAVAYTCGYREGAVDALLIWRLFEAPPVHGAGGRSCRINADVVARSQDWPFTDADLLRATRAATGLDTGPEVVSGRSVTTP
jgi:hypothetical protein